MTLYDKGRAMLTSKQRRNAIRDFLSEIWLDAKDNAYMFLAQTKPWREIIIQRDDIVSFDLLSTKRDLYFCPTLFSRSQRRKEYALPSRWLHVDLDNGDASALKRPTIQIETSPGKLHLLWQLDELEDVENVEAMNRWLARESGADSCWDITRYLRVPHTFNCKPENVAKYGEAVPVNLLSHRDELLEWRPPKLPAARRNEVVTRGDRCLSVSPLTFKGYQKMRHEYGLPLMGALLLRKANDRSRVLAAIVETLMDYDVPEQKIWAAVRMSPAYQSRVEEKGQKVVDQDVIRLMGKHDAA